jgi:hypothetical protein
LQKGKLSSIRLSQVHKTEAAKTFYLNGGWRVSEEPLTHGEQRLRPVEVGQEGMILPRGNQTVKKTSFKEFAQEFSDKDYRINRSDHGQSFS